MKNIKKLAKIKNREDIKSFEIIERYEDDHLQCADVKINDIPISFNHYDCLGFLSYYHDSDTAFNELKEAIKTSIEIEIDS